MIVAEDVALLVQAWSDQLKTWQAGFEQTFTLRVQNTSKNQKGKLAFERPGKMSFRYDSGDRVVSDGTTVRVYEKQHKQMFELALKKSLYPASLAFLVGKAKLVEEFRWSLRDAKKLGWDGWVLDGSPKESSPAYQRLLLYAETKTGAVKRVLVLDAEGNKNRFDFDGAAANKALTRGEFEFTPPPGTKIVRP
jgi:outer membrane lipoprotein carrier protein